jgi:hypothetical protein
VSFCSVAQVACDLAYSSATCFCDPSIFSIARPDGLATLSGLSPSAVGATAAAAAGSSLPRMWIAPTLDSSRSEATAFMVGISLD